MLSEDCKVFIKSVNKVKTSKNGKSKKLSGYNVFCMEKRKKLEGSPGEIMKELGGMWKETSEKEKEKYKNKSIKLNEVALKEFEENKVDDDPQVLELKSQITELIKKFKKENDKKTKDKKEDKKGKSKKVKEEEEEEEGEDEEGEEEYEEEE